MNENSIQPPIIGAISLKSLGFFMFIEKIKSTLLMYRNLSAKNPFSASIVFGSIDQANRAMCGIWVFDKKLAQIWPHYQQHQVGS